MEEVITLLREGNHNAYEHLFETLYEPLCRYAYSILRDGAETEDAVQRIFCKLWDQRADLTINSSINSYLYRMVHNDCLNKIQQQNSHKEHNLNYIASIPDSNDSVSDYIGSNELQATIDRALETLPPQCKRVFEMSRKEQLSYSEIAQQLGISTNTVENHIAKALKLLRVELKDFLTLWILFQFLK